jgi:ABC-type Fe3+-hydroxamate transport system substrate-binding protein
LSDLLNKTTDMTGRKVRVPLRVNRMLSTSEAMDERLLLLGGPEKLVATSDTIPLGNEERFPGGF